MRLNEVTKKLGALRIPVSLRITPINLEQEKEKFFDSETYSPIFQYRKKGNNNDKIFKELGNLQTISDVDPRISDFYIKLISHKHDASELIKAIGNNSKMSEISVRMYGKPSEKLFRNSTLIAKGKVARYKLVEEPKLQKMLEGKEVMDKINMVLKEVGLADWSAISSKNIAKNGIRVGVKRRIIAMDPKIKRTPFALRKTVIHEIGTHALRAYNGYKSGFEALSKANVRSYLDIEEGLALYNEELFGHLTLKNLKRSALYSYAIYIGEELSFRQLFNALVAIVPRKEAFDITYRVKRGLYNTEVPGIYAKDIAYFRGFKKVRRALEQDNSLYPLLYAGKIDLKMVEWVRDGLIPKPKVILDKDVFKKAFAKAGL